MGDVISDLVIKTILFVVITVGAYYTTKFVGKRTISATKGKYIRVIDKLFLAKDKWLYIVKVGEDYHLLAVTNTGIRQICPLNSEYFVEDLEASTDQGENTFLKYLNKINWFSHDKPNDYDALDGHENGFKDRINWINAFKKKNLRD
jgi:flagellar protein FliO/FliZ